jgi:hypothetical protein
MSTIEKVTLIIGIVGAIAVCILIPTSQSVLPFVLSYILPAIATCVLFAVIILKYPQHMPQRSIMDWARYHLLRYERSLRSNPARKRFVLICILAVVSSWAVPALYASFYTCFKFFMTYWEANAHYWQAQ